MQATETTSEQEFIPAFALQRQKLLHHVGTILGDTKVASDPAVRQLSQSLLTSLELLKVAEEELREERRTNTMRAIVHERRIAHITTLFDLAPVALVLTAADTTIRELNKAAAAFLGFDSHAAEGRRLSDMIPGDQRVGFREQLGHAIAAEEVAAWSFKIEPHRSVPAMVSASVRLIDDASIGTRALYWTLRPE